MKIREINTYIKPKNYSKKVNIASCECSIYYFEDNKQIILDIINIKYKVAPNEKSSYIKPIRNTWSTMQYSNHFEEIVDMPKYMFELDYEDFEIKISHFKRDNVYVSFVAGIEIKNINNYLKLKNKFDRKEKIYRLSKNK